MAAASTPSNICAKYLPSPIMSFSDNLENSLKNLESHDERDAAGGAHSQQRRRDQRGTVLASAPYVVKMRPGNFTSRPMTHATPIGDCLRTEANISWLSSTPRNQACQHRPAPRRTA